MRVDGTRRDGHAFRGQTGRMSRAFGRRRTTWVVANARRPTCGATRRRGPGRLELRLCEPPSFVISHFLDFRRSELWPLAGGRASPPSMGHRILPRVFQSAQRSRRRSTSRNMGPGVASLAVRAGDSPTSRAPPICFMLFVTFSTLQQLLVLRYITTLRPFSLSSYRACHS